MRPQLRLSRAASLALALSPAEWFRILTVVGRLARIELLLRLRPLPVVAAHVGAELVFDERPSPPEALDHHLACEEWLNLVAIDRACKRWPFGDTCLRRALSMAVAVKKHDPMLRIGVAKLANGEIGAHAWLDCQTFSIGLDPVIDYSAMRSPASL